MAKTIFKYKHDGDLGYMHFVELDGEIAVLSKLDSLKVEFINENGYLDVTTELKSEDYKRVTFKVVTDQAYVQKVYDFMLETENSYFKDGIDGLCALVSEK